MKMCKCIWFWTVCPSRLYWTAVYFSGYGFVPLFIPLEHVKVSLATEALLKRVSGADSALSQRVTAASMFVHLNHE